MMNRGFRGRSDLLLLGLGLQQTLIPLVLETPQLVLKLLAVLLRSTELLLGLLPQLPQGGPVLRLQAVPHGFLPPGGGTSPRIKSAVCIPLGSDGDGALATAEPPDLLRDQPLHLLLVFGGGLAQGLLGLQLGGVQRLSQSLFLPLGLGQQILAV